MSPDREGLILVVDDDADIARFVEMNLTFEGFDVAVAYDGYEALAVIERRRPDLVLLDVMMPRIDGVELCRQLRADPMTAALPVIMLTAKGLSADKVLGLTAGADDYIIKPFDTLELIARVRSTLRRNREMRDVSPLTGLPGNTRILDEIAERFAARSAGGDEYAVCYVDMDNFKTVNDVYGFFRGDQMIAALAAALHDAVVEVGRPKPFLGHIGGDDFIVVCTPEQVGPITERTIAHFAQGSPALYDREDAERGYFEVLDRQGRRNRHGLLTLSIGVALSTQRAFTDHREVVAVATEMKQVAKRNPGSVVAVDRRRDREPGRGPGARGSVTAEHRRPDFSRDATPGAVTAEHPRPDFSRDAAPGNGHGWASATPPTLPPGSTPGPAPSRGGFSSRGGGHPAEPSPPAATLPPPEPLPPAAFAPPSPPAGQFPAKPRPALPADGAPFARSPQRGEHQTGPQRSAEQGRAVDASGQPYGGRWGGAADETGFFDRRPKAETSDDAEGQRGGAHSADSQGGGRGSDTARRPATPAWEA